MLKISRDQKVKSCVFQDTISGARPVTVARAEAANGQRPILAARLRADDVGI